MVTMTGADRPSECNGYAQRMAYIWKAGSELIVQPQIVAGSTDGEVSRMTGKSAASRPRKTPVAACPSSRMSQGEAAALD
jgi:hypothetical protein